MKDRYVADTMAVVLRLEKRRVSMQVKEGRKKSGLTHR
jgi:hypothetical protein